MASLSPSFGLRCFTGSPSSMTVAHQHNDLEINVSGSDLYYLVGGRSLSVPAGQPCVFWAATPHQLVEAAEDFSWMTVPLPMSLGWRIPDAALRSLLAGGWLLAPPDQEVARTRASIGSWALELESDDTVLSELATLEVEAWVTRLCLAVTDTTEAMELPGPTALSAQFRASHTDPPRERGSRVAALAMAEFLAEHFADSVTVAEVAASVHLHPGHAATVFRTVIGITIGAYLRQLRIAEAQRLLVTTEDPVLEIARTCGFPTTSTFYAAFAASVGMAPQRFRRSHR